MINSRDSTRWWVVFKDADRRHWYTRFLKSGYEHAFCFTEIRPNTMLMVNARESEFEFLVLDDVAWNWVRTCLGQGWRVVVVEVERTDYGLGKRWPFWTCVTVVAHTLGIPTWAFSPWQLYRHLIKRGGQDLNELRGWWRRCERGEFGDPAASGGAASQAGSASGAGAHSAATGHRRITSIALRSVDWIPRTAVRIRAWYHLKQHGRRPDTPRQTSSTSRQ